MPHVADLVFAMEAIAPTRDAAPWDNVGLLVGDERAPLSRVLLAIDATPAVLAEAVATKCDALVAYHPVLFDAQKRFLAGSPAYDLARAGIAAYSPHTAFDVAPGGTNDVLADALGMTERAPLRPVDPLAAEVKLVTFVPAEHVETVSRALFDAGAGRIGNYASCSFRTPGIGTFFGQEGTAPVVGSAGRLEEVAELRLETRVPASRVDAVVRALRQSHPYEEPAFDLVRLAEPSVARGFGRVGAVSPAPASAHLQRVKAALGIDRALVAGDLGRNVKRAAVAAGSGGDLVRDAVAQGAELLLTGELRHHDALAATRAGLVVLSVLHSVSERGALAALERRLRELLPGVAVSQSRTDRDPFVIA
jgi:dinuclear metal center YbgI/SA1388 family protein